MKFNKSNAYTDFDYETAEEMPDALPLNIISGGCHLYGYLLKPGAQYEGPHPAVVMFHGFPGYTTNNDLEYALMRMGCVVIHVNHRGAGCDFPCRTQYGRHDGIKCRRQTRIYPRRRRDCTIRSACSFSKWP